MQKAFVIQSFTGVAVLEFDQISREIECKYEEYERRRLLSKRKRRKRDVGAGRP
jgi:hypothetical protein